MHPYFRFATSKITKKHPENTSYYLLKCITKSLFSILTIGGSNNTVGDKENLTVWIFETKFLGIYLTTGKAEKYSNNILEKANIGLIE